MDYPNGVIVTTNFAREDLTDDKRFALLFCEFVRLKWYGLSRLHFQEFASYAEEALAEDRYDTPGRLFAALIKQDDHRITQAQEDRALARFPPNRIYEIIDWVKKTSTIGASSDVDESLKRTSSGVKIQRTL